MGARKEGFKKRTVAGNDRGYRIVGAFVKSLSRINELIFCFGGNFEFRDCAIIIWRGGGF